MPILKIDDECSNGNADIASAARKLSHIMRGAARYVYVEEFAQNPARVSG
jgi:hypothetical protein